MASKIFRPSTAATHRLFTTNSTYSSGSIENCPSRSFAMTYTDAARDVLSIPFFFGNCILELNPMLQKDETLEDYLKWRGWDIPKILQHHKLGTDNDEQSAVGLLSHPLTFPLTLTRYVSELNFGKTVDERKNIRICCVGARAECTLPDEYWQECLVTAATNTHPHQLEETTFHYTIDFIGPDIPKHLKSKTITLEQHPQRQHNRYELTMNYHTAFLHEVILDLLKSMHKQDDGDDNTQSTDRTESIRNIWDAFVLFNPGIGHPNLQKEWMPTLKFLVGTGKSILFTAHSTIDAKRDSLVIEKLLLADIDEIGSSLSDRHVKYTLNPYASRMGYLDPFASPSEMGDEPHIVRPNHSIFMLNIGGS